MVGPHRSLAQLAPLMRLGLSALGTLLVVLVACSDEAYMGPVYGEGCSDDQQGIVTLEGELRVAEVFVTRDYVEVEIYGGNNVVERRHRTCQEYRCRVTRGSQGPLTDPEITAALAACRQEADAAWRTEHQS